MLLFLTATLGCTDEKASKYKVAFSQCSSGDLWRQQMNQEMIRAAKLTNVDLEIKDAESSSLKQIEQINQFLNQEIDLLIVSPNEASPLTPIIQKAHKSGIPIILVDRKIDSLDYDAFVGGNNFLVGYEAGVYLANMIKSEANILEVSGLMGSSPAYERHNGFVKAISKYPRFKIIASVEGNWDEEQAYNAVSGFSYKDSVDVVFAHNDVMSIGARRAFDGFSKSIVYVGVDALSGLDGGVQKIIDGEITFSLYYPTGGKEAIELAQKILSNESHWKYNLLPTVVVDKSNANTIQMQANLLQSYENDIDRLQDVQESLLIKQKDLKLITYLVFSGFLLFVFITIVAVHAYIKKNSLSKKQQELNNLLIERQNEINDQNITLSGLNYQISEQKEELERHQTQLEFLVEERTKELNIEKYRAQESDRLKTAFLSNISHEIRTPLNAIVGFSTLLAQSDLTDEITNEFTNTIINNSEALLYLINNIVDLSQIEANHLYVNIELISVNQILSELPSVLKIDPKQEERVSLIIKPLESEILLFTDKSRVLQILKNLLTNAYKFTSEGEVELGFVVQDNSGLFYVKDTGIGIADVHVGRIFNSFIKIDEDPAKLYRGVGIGLYISKRLSELLGGKLWFETKIGVGSTFYLSLPISPALINRHIDKIL